MTADGQPIRSRHGLTFIPGADLAAAAARLERLVVPGADAARRAAGAVILAALGLQALRRRDGYT